MEEVLEVQGTVENGQLVIRVAQAVSIEENLERMRVQVLAEIDKALLMTGDGSIADLKKVVSYANRLIEDMNDKRKAVKNEVLKPCDMLKERIDSISAEVLKRVGAIKARINEDEERRLRERKAVIAEIITERLSKADGRVEAYIRKCIGNFYNIKWENFSASVKSIELEVDKRVIQIEQDLAALALIANPTIQAAVQLKYEETGNIALCLAYQHSLEVAEADAKRREAQKSEPTTEPITQQHEEKVLESDGLVEVSFRVKATMAKITALKQFMKENGILYGSVK